MLQSPWLLQVDWLTLYIQINVKNLDVNISAKLTMTQRRLSVAAVLDSLSIMTERIVMVRGVRISNYIIEY